MEIGSYNFVHICVVVPEVDGNGKVSVFQPQALYVNHSNLIIHKYGHGPFCKFVIPKIYREEGVYALTIEDEIKYLGECRNLSSRYNSGYGNISPRNCYNGGQRTNCRINSLIFQEFLRGKQINLWFLQTGEHKAIEKELLLRLQPPPAWNLRGLRILNQMNSNEYETIRRWHKIVRTRDASGLSELLAADVAFYSPVVHTPQVGQAVTARYLTAALRVFGNGSFKYVREVIGERDAVLEFETEIDGITINGVDMIKWNGDGKIVEFKVMIRPLKAINLIHQKMAAMLSAS